MSTDQPEFGKGFLRGLKKVLFTDGGDAPAESPTTPGAGSSNPATTGTNSNSPVTPGANNASTASANRQAASHQPSMYNPANDSVSSQRIAAANAADSSAMTEKVYQLLESMNQSGIDFLEVWKAARDMGGANAANIRAAFTSLRYADQQLTRERLLSSGENYIAQLQQVIRTEREKKQEEKKRLETQREENRLRLDKDISQMETEIARLQQRLVELKGQRTRIDEDYMPKVRSIDDKVQAGQQAVDQVIAEIRTVVAIIQKDIN